MSDQGTEIFRGVDVIRDIGTAFLCLVGRKQVWVPLTEIRYGTDLTKPGDHVRSSSRRGSLRHWTCTDAARRGRFSRNPRLSP
jgi:hypothetical protein